MRSLGYYFNLIDIVFRGGFNTLQINFLSLPFRQAIHFPIWCGPNVYFEGIRKGCIKCPQNVKSGSIRLGMKDGSFGIHHGVRSFLKFGKNGTLIFEGKARFYQSYHINIYGTVSIGDGVYVNTGLIMSCTNKIWIGARSILGWNITIIDGDGHNLYDRKNSLFDLPIIIGEHCWITANCTLLKGISLAQDTIIPFGSIIRKSNTQCNVIFNNRVLKENISWEQ